MGWNRYAIHGEKCDVRRKGRRVGEMKRRWCGSAGRERSRQGRARNIVAHWDERNHMYVCRKRAAWQWELLTCYIQQLLRNGTDATRYYKGIIGVDE